MVLIHHITQCKKTYYYQKLCIYYETYQLTETLLSGEVRNQIDTCIRDYCLVKKYVCFKNYPLLKFSNTAQKCNRSVVDWLRFISLLNMGITFARFQISRNIPFHQNTQRFGNRFGDTLDSLWLMPSSPLALLRLIISIIVSILCLVQFI